MAHKGWLESFMPTWAWFVLLVVCVGIASIVGKALHPNGEQPSGIVNSVPTGSSVPTSSPSFDGEAPPCKAAMEAASQSIDRRNARDERLLDSNYARISAADAKGERARIKEAERQDIQEAEIKAKDEMEDENLSARIKADCPPPQK